MKQVDTVLAHAFVCTLVAFASAAMGMTDEASAWEAVQRELAAVVREVNIGADVHEETAGIQRVTWDAAAGVASLGDADASQRGGVEDWPVAPGGFETLGVRVHAVILADDDGRRRTPVNPSEIALWVERANETLASSGIVLEFDPSVGSDDWVEMNSTLLNTMVGNSSPDWAAQRQLANLIAATTPDAMTVYFRWGPGVNATGAAFSWTDIDFIVMSGFEVTRVCGEQNIGLFAHEVGHYLGLPHTFRYIGSSVSSVESFFVINGNDPNVFDGDGRDETSPDPFVSDVGVQCGTGTLTLDGYEFELPRENAMSYYHPISGFVPSQSTTMRQTLRLRTGRALTDGGVVFEPRVSDVSVSGGGVLMQDMSAFLGRWSGDTQLLWIDGEIGDVLTTQVGVSEAGRYRAYASMTAANDFGVVEHRLNGQASAPIDLYSTLVLCTGRVYLGEFDLAEGDNLMEVEIVGVNPRSAFPRQAYGLDHLILESVCEADLNGDGSLDFFDVSAFLGAFGANDPVADFNGDGSWDFFDVSAFLGAFNEGCP
jgi:hypothetical protein